MSNGKRARAGLKAMILAASGVPLASVRFQLPASALPGGTQTHLIDLNFQARRSEAFATIAIHPVGQPRLTNASGLLKAHVSTTDHLGLESNLPSKDKQAANAEDDVPAHPPPFCIVPTRTSAEPAAEPAKPAEQLLTENKGVGALQGGSGTDMETTMTSTKELNRVERPQEGSGGWADVETYVQTTSEFNGNGGAFVAPLGGGTSSVYSVKDSEGDEAFFATWNADTRMKHQQHQHPSDWMRAFERFRPRTSGRKLLGMAKASARGGDVVQRLLTKGLEKLHAHVADTATASMLIGCASLRFGSKAVLLLTLVAGSMQSAAAANTTTTRSVATQTNTTSSIGGISSGWTCLPGDADCISDDTDEKTWTWLEVITDVLALTTVLRFLWFSAVWFGGTVTTCAMWARYRRSRSRRASVSPSIPTADAAAVAGAVVATATPVIAAPPTGAAAYTASTVSVTATPATAATPNTAAAAVASTAAPAREEAAAPATSSSAETAPATVPMLRRARSYFERMVSNLTEAAVVVGEAASNVGDAALELVVVVHPTPAEAEAEAEAVRSPVAVSNTSVAASTTAAAASPGMVASQMVAAVPNMPETAAAAAAASPIMAASREPTASTASATAAVPATIVFNTTANDAAAVPAAVEGVVAGSSAEPAAAAAAGGVGRPPVLLRSLSYFDRMVSNLTEAASAVSEAVSNVGDAASNLGNALDMV